MITRAFHAWERRLASADSNRVVRPFEWGLDWLDLPANVVQADADPRAVLTAWTNEAVANSDTFFAVPSPPPIERLGDRLTFQSVLTTPHAENNIARLRIFPARVRRRAPRRAVVVLPQWNADAQGHVGLCRLFASFGITAVRLTMPYHEARRPPDLARADYIVSANLGRTIQACRQAVLDAKCAVAWLAAEGYERIGIAGTSLGSCLSLLAMAHEPRIRVGAFNLISPYFGDVIWRGLSTAHVRAGLEGHVSIEDLRQFWLPISPWPFLSRVADRPALLVYARYDLTFPVDLSKAFVAEFARQRARHEVAVLPCGHYATGKMPFKYLDGYVLVRFFLTNL